LAQLQAHVALLSGGEPSLNPKWRKIAWLLFQTITLSVDRTDAATYQAIRDLDAFDKVFAAVRAAATGAVPVGIRVTLRRSQPPATPGLRRVGAAPQRPRSLLIPGAAASREGR
jgi:MoaA/NifB/PqqE/SkfB family radical SAM enzyme